MAVSINGTSGLVFTDGTTQNTSPFGGMGFRNRIINGAMGIWQRGTSFSNSGHGTYSADRWTTSTIGINLTLTRDTSSPSTAYKYSLKAVPASNATATECVVRQFIEQQNIFDFAGQTITATAWVNCSKSAVKFRLGTQNATGGGDVAYTMTVTAGSWTKITYSFSSFSAVTAWTSTPNDSGGFLDIGFLDGTALTTSDYIYITGVQLEKGSTATSFDYRPYGTELALCQRYYWGGSNLVGVGVTTGAVSALVNVPSVTMRAAPNFTINGTPAFRYGGADYPASSFTTFAVANMIQISFSIVNAGNGNTGSLWTYGVNTTYSFSAEL